MERAKGVRDADDGQIAEGRDLGGPGSSATSRAAAPAEAAARRNRCPSVCSPSERDEQLARHDETRVHRGTADRSVGAPEEVAAGQLRELPRSERGADDEPAGRAGTSRERGDGRSVTRVSVAQAGARDAARDVADSARLIGGHPFTLTIGTDSKGRSGRRPVTATASVAMRRKSSNDITGISSWPTRRTLGWPSLMRTAMTRSGWPVCRPT